MTRKIIVVVRSDDVSEKLSERITTAGYSALHERLLTAVGIDFTLPDMTSRTALVFTSAHAVTAFARKTVQPDNPVFTVGPQTAEAARTAGFTIIHDAGGTVTDLVSIIESHAGRYDFLYLRGAYVSADLKNLLSEKTSFTEVVVYDMLPAEKLSPALCAGLRGNDIAALLFFSKRGAETFATLAKQQEMTPHLQGIKALCIGEGMVQSVSVLPFSSVLVSKTPDRDGMTDLIDDISGPLTGTQETL